jgi:hypothetical protein
MTGGKILGIQNRVFEFCTQKSIRVGTHKQRFRTLITLHMYAQLFSPLEGNPKTDCSAVVGIGEHAKCEKVFTRAHEYLFFEGVLDYFQS